MVMSPYNHQRLESNTEENPRQKYAKIYNGIGITNIVLGCIAAVLAVTGLAFESYSCCNRDIAAGIWGGVMLIISGTIAVNTARMMTKCMLVLTMLASAISAGVGLAMFGVELAFAVKMNNHNYWQYYYAKIVLLVIHGVLSFIGFTGMILSIVNTVYSSYALCTGHSVSFSIQRDQNGFATVTVTRTSPGDQSNPECSAQPQDNIEEYENIPTQQEISQNRSPPERPPPPYAALSDQKQPPV
uniref:Uncharacterized LOC100175973 n=1 Tax=Ciona intestinalis TaxID=7719 RepID=A0A1W5BGR0_CIOIN|nr:uncharacterized protein LOC100175973 [Ciona intestinalis]XP_018671480.1 uncharacterized protein LOC100175973 [Ciona intestinalis]|eukprot:XP_002131617.1 uncharacterized protein LOC100175973 [Ciona intestinalis]